MGRVNKRTITVESRSLGPTPERIAKAGEENITKVFDNDGNKIISMRDAPLDRMLSRKAIDPIEYTALLRFKHHWHHGGLTPSMGSVDLGRVFSSDPGGFSGMAKSERQAHHRQQYREACEVLGNRGRATVENVVCSEQNLDIAGFALGWGSKPQAIAAASEMLRDAGYRLAKLWGLQ